jgi:hypothetical protein
MSRKVDAAEGVQTESSSREGFGQSPKEERSVDVFCQMDGYGTVGEGRLEED